MAADPFASIPEPQFFDSDPTLLAQAFLVGYEAGYQAFSGVPLTLGAADPRRYHELYNSFLISQAYVNGNYVAKQNTLKYATGVNLDVLGSYWGDRGLRLQPSAAATTLLFSVAIASAVDIPIPAGTSVATSTSPPVVFTTNADAILLASTLSVSVAATASVTGVVGNDFVPGQITSLQNWVSPYVVTATNLTASQGGADLESDDRYRQRLVLLPQSLSTCGTKGGYEFFALSANAQISQVAVYSNPGISGTVVLAPLMDGGELPTTDTLSAVLAACSPLTNRPLSDNVIAIQPSGIAFSVSVAFYVPQDQAPNVVNLVNGANTVVTDFVSTLRGQLGGVIDPSQLESSLYAPGVVGIQVAEPTFTQLNEWEHPVLVNDPVVAYVGLTNN